MGLTALLPPSAAQQFFELGRRLVQIFLTKFVGARGADRLLKLVEHHHRMAVWLISTLSKIGTGGSAGPKLYVIIARIIEWLGSPASNLAQMSHTNR